MAPDVPEQELQELRARVAELTQRVYKLEQKLGVGTPAAPAAASPAPPKPAAPSTTIPPRPTSTTAGDPSAPMPPRPAAAAPPPDISLESRIGAQWLNRIGVFALLVGAAYFLKLAFDNNWIGPSGRVAIGMLAGIALVFWSSRIHARGYRYFSYSLTAVGVGVMYLSLWAAFQLYHLLPSGVAFVLMILVTASAGLLAIKQDAQILAVVALSGGFATPLLLSTGENRPLELFSYIAVLDIAAIALVALKPWRRLLAGTFVATVLFYAGWFQRFFRDEQRPIAIFFATLFFVLFAVLPLIKLMNPRFGQSPDWAQSKTFISVAFFNPVVYFLELYAALEALPDVNTWLAWIAIALGAAYIVLSKGTANAEQTEGTNAKFQSLLHLGIAIGFLTIAIPLRLETYWITFGWLAESAVLLYVAKRLNSRFIGAFAIAALGLAVVRLLAVDTYLTERLLFNARFVAYALAVAILVFIARELRDRPTKELYILVTVTLNVLALIGLSAEVHDWFRRAYTTTDAAGYIGMDWQNMRLGRDFAYSALWMLYGAVLLIVGFKRTSAELRWQALVLLAFTIGKVFIYDLSELSGAYRVVSFMALGVILLGISFIYQRDWLKLSSKHE
jgi:uncharacterized membrane protein